MSRSHHADGRLTVRLTPHYLYPTHINGDRVRQITISIVPMPHHRSVHRKVNVIIRRRLQLATHTENRMRSRIIHHLILALLATRLQDWRYSLPRILRTLKGRETCQRTIPRQQTMKPDASSVP